MSFRTGQVGRGIALRRLGIQGLYAGKQTIYRHLSRFFRRTLPLARHIVPLEPQGIYPQFHGQFRHHLAFGIPLA